MPETPTSKRINGTMTRKEFDDLTPELNPEHRDMLWGMVNNPTNTSWDIQDYSSQCSMCGKDMPYRFCGMCTHCEMVWNG